MVERVGSRRAMVTAVGLVATCGLPGFLVASLAPSMRADLQLGDGALGLAFSIFWGAGAVSASFGGKLAQRLGWQHGIRLSGGLIAMSTLIVALFVSSTAGLMALLALGGLANAVALPSASLLLSERVGRERQGVAFGISQAGAPAAALVAGLALPVIALSLDWRAAFALAALAGAAVVLSVPRVGRDRAPAAERVLAARAPLTPALVTLAVGAGIGTMAAGAANGFLVVSGVDAGLSEGAAGLLLALGSVLTVATRVALGVLADRPGTRHLLLTAGMLVLGAVGLVLLASGRPAPFVAGALLAFVAGWGWLGLFMFAIVDQHRGAAGAATGVAQTGLLTGGCLGPLGFGLLVERSSFEFAWFVAAALAVVSALTLLLGRHLLLGTLRAARHPA